MDAGETAGNRHTVTWYDVMIWYWGDSEVGSWNVSGSNQLNE